MTRRRNPYSFGSVDHNGEYQDHEGKLKAFFGRWQGMFEKSIQGGIEDQLSMYSHHQAQKWEDAHGGGSIYPDGDVTANITAETRSAGGADPELGPLADYSFALRRTGLVRQRDPLLYDVLRCWFGPIGEHWESLAIERVGRMGALYHLTDAGIALLLQEEARPASTTATAAPKPELKGMNRTQRRKAARMAREEMRAAGASDEQIEAGNAGLEGMMRTRHGRMLTLLSGSDLSDAVRVGIARCDDEAMTLLSLARVAWNDADAQLMVEQGRAVRR